MKRRLPYARLTIVQSESDSLSRRRCLDTRQSPYGVAPRVRGARRSQDVIERGYRAASKPSELMERSILNGRPAIVEQFRELGRFHRVPGESATAWILNSRRALATDAVNGPEHLRGRIGGEPVRHHRRYGPQTENVYYL